jgi:hypothetical protein
VQHRRRRAAAACLQARAARAGRRRPRLRQGDRGARNPVRPVHDRRRPELKKLSGQEKLPVLQLPDGSTVNGSGEIIAWARSSVSS